jgi:hypothetical protein
MPLPLPPLLKDVAMDVHQAVYALDRSASKLSRKWIRELAAWQKRDDTSPAYEPSYAPMSMYAPVPGTPLCRCMRQSQVRPYVDVCASPRYGGARFAAGLDHGFCCARVSIIGLRPLQSARFVWHVFALDDGIGSHACSLKALPCV